jgi:methylase of polypeptide subunit release factors
MGCGSGRWARFVAPHVGRLHCIDPSSALAVARQTFEAGKVHRLAEAHRDPPEAPHL